MDGVEEGALQKASLLQDMLFRSTAFPQSQDQFLGDGHRHRNITHTSSPTEPPSGFSHKEEKKKL